MNEKIYGYIISKDRSTADEIANYKQNAGNIPYSFRKIST
jgi:hypothetical protein